MERSGTLGKLPQRGSPARGVGKQTHGFLTTHERGGTLGKLSTLRTMNVTVALEHRFTRKPDGTVWTDGPFGYSFFSRYLKVFDSVRVAARVTDDPDSRRHLIRAGGPGVSFLPLPYYVGPGQYLRRSWSLHLAARNAVRTADAVILRVPSQVAISVAAALRTARHPFGLEVVGDPHDAFAPGSHTHPLRPLIRWHHVRQLGRQCRQAGGVSYVTRSALQNRYPTSDSAFATHYSSVELPPEAFVHSPRGDSDPRRPFRLITVGSLEHLYKGPDTLVEAVALCVAQGFDLQLTLVGDGRRRPELEAMAAARGLQQRVRFSGQRPAGKAVRELLDQEDLFVLASRQEGVPRAMIEAMARALPAIGTHAGGIPELLPGDCRVPPHDPVSLARKFREVVTSPQRLSRMSCHNFAKARDYAEDRLQPRREAFYRYLRDQTQAWKRRRVSVPAFGFPGWAKTVSRRS